MIQKAKKTATGPKIGSFYACISSIPGLTGQKKPLTVTINGDKLRKEWIFIAFLGDNI